MELFPKDMGNLSLEGIGGKIAYYKEQLQLYHWQTQSYAEHKTLDEMITNVKSLGDDIVEKVMGYSNRRIKNFKIEPINNYNTGCCINIANDIIRFSVQLKSFANENNMLDVGNLADALSGIGAKYKYLFTLK